MCALYTDCLLSFLSPTSVVLLLCIPVTIVYMGYLISDLMLIGLIKYIVDGILL